MRRLATIAAGLAVLAGVLGLGYWAGTNAVVPPTLPADKQVGETYRVERGTVASSTRIPITAAWAVLRTLYAGREGTVTSVSVGAGDIVRTGSVVATIDLQPVVIVPGSTPMFRDLRDGVDGPDVSQFQALLKSLGQFDGVVDGHFGSSTTAAARRWQQSVGATVDGVIETGSLMFIDRLPARLAVLVSVGQRVGSGSDFVHVFSPQPDFVATVAASTRADLTAGLAVSIQGPASHTWSGSIGAIDALEDGRFSVQIDGSLCGDDCALVPASGQSSLTGTIQLVPETSGPVVPTSALVRQASGDLSVTLIDGTLRKVRIVAQADGFAVVDGISEGTVIDLPLPPGS